jgi:hypothetical protein
MRRQYQINHRTRNTRFDKQELIARLEDNRVSTWSTNRGEETRPKASLNYGCHAVLLQKAGGNRHLGIELKVFLIESDGCQAVLLQRAGGNGHLEIKLKGL